MHSRYRRLLADFPWQQIPARLTRWSRRFFRDTQACPRRIFTEQLPRVAAPHARRTNRLHDWLGHLASALLAAAEAWAREQRLPLVALGTGAANARARAFYARQGYLADDVRLAKIL